MYETKRKVFTHYVLCINSNGGKQSDSGSKFNPLLWTNPGDSGCLLRGGKGRDSGLPWAKRCRQNDYYADFDLLYASDQRRRQSCWLRRVQSIHGSTPTHRLLAGAAAGLYGHERQVLLELRRQNQRRG